MLLVGLFWDSKVLFVVIMPSSDCLYLCFGIMVISIYLTSLLFCVGNGNLFKFWYDCATVLIIIVALPCFVLWVLDVVAAGLFSSDAFVFGVLVFWIVWSMMDPMQRRFFSIIYVLYYYLEGSWLFVISTLLRITLSVFLEEFGAVRKSCASFGVATIFEIEDWLCVVECFLPDVFEGLFWLPDKSRFLFLSD